MLFQLALSLASPTSDECQGCICSSPTSRQLLLISSTTFAAAPGTKSGANKSRPFHYFPPAHFPLLPSPSLQSLFRLSHLTLLGRRLLRTFEEMKGDSSLPSTRLTFLLLKFEAFLQNWKEKVVKLRNCVLQNLLQLELWPLQLLCRTLPMQVCVVSVTFNENCPFYTKFQIFENVIL